MPRVAAFRFLITLLAFVAISMDTATKVLHGVAHQREAYEHAVHQGALHYNPHIADAASRHESAVESPDADADHGALHNAASARVVLKVQAALPSAHQVWVAASVALTPVAPFRVVQPRPPSALARPTQPRAPPLG